MTKYSPSGSLPFLVIDGKAYNETVALMRYLACKYPNKGLCYVQCGEHIYH